MTISELIQDESRRQHEFPVCENKTFLAHAAVSPLPRRVAEAMSRYLTAATLDHQEAGLTDRVVSETRQLAAELIAAKPSEIAFTGSTSMGLAMVATGLPWQPGDNVVCYRDDYPANVYPWMELANRGVAVRFVEPTVPGNITVADLARVVDGQTRLVALASAHFVTGWRLDVDAIGKFLHEHGVLFCLDGIQTIGALRTEMTHVDFAAADAHKWLLGPLGTAILYVRQEHFDRLRPPLVGWNNAACPGFVAQDTLRLRPDARRYEPGSLNLVGIVGLHAALEMIQDFGLDAIEGRVLALARCVHEGLIASGWRVLGPSEGLAGIVSFTKPGIDLSALHAQLTAAGIAISLRQHRNGEPCLRASPHFYNTESEIDRLLTAL